jgi:hypothetical protein
MAIIDDIRDNIASGQFEFAQHAVDQSIVRHISVQELREAMPLAKSSRTIPRTNMGQAA